jgi:SAM-dependent methyltransferase
MRDEMPGTVASPRPCPVCGTSSTELLYAQRFANFAAGSIGDGYDVVACDHCGMCFATGLPDPERFAEYYADSSKYDLSASGASLLATDVQRYADQAEFVAANVADRSAPVLDVGTATGGFLQALQAAGFEHPYGVDPSPDAVRVARDEFGLDVVVGGLDAAESWGHKFGLVSYVAVFEHVLEPREQARSVSRVLRPNGCVFISVPDAGSFKDHVAAPFQEFSVEHINYFTRRSLANAMGAEGYSLVADRVIVLPLGTDGHGPALEAVYRRDGVAKPAVPDSAGADALREYIRRSQRTEDGILDRIAGLASTGQRIYVWGTGTHTLHLLQTSRLGDCRIEAFIDSNPHYAGATLAGRPVMAPSDRQAVDAPILVSSAVSQSGIAAAARERFGQDVPLILLY